MMLLGGDLVERPWVLLGLGGLGQLWLCGRGGGARGALYHAV